MAETRIYTLEYSRNNSHILHTPISPRSRSRRAAAGPQIPRPPNPQRNPEFPDLSQPQQPPTLHLCANSPSFDVLACADKAHSEEAALAPLHAPVACLRRCPRSAPRMLYHTAHSGPCLLSRLRS